MTTINPSPNDQKTWDSQEDKKDYPQDIGRKVQPVKIPSSNNSKWDYSRE